MERKGPPTMPKALTAMPARRMVPPPQQPQQPPPHQHQHQQSRAATVPPAIPLSPGQVVAIVREARKKARQGDDSRAVADTDADGIKPGITLDLIAKNIPTLPDEVVEILRNGVERYVNPMLWMLRRKCADFEPAWPSRTTSSPRCQCDSHSAPR